MGFARAGWADGDITPPLGVPFGGRGPRFAPAVAVLDPLAAQAVVMEDSAGNRTLWVSLDLVGLSREIADPLRYELAALTGVPYESVIVNCSHTHSGPMTIYGEYPTCIPKPDRLSAYEKDLRERILGVACKAVDALQPVRVTLHLGRSEVGVNRRGRSAVGEVSLAPDPNGFYNPDLTVIGLRTEDGSAQCVVFSYGCHAVIVYGYAWDSISADYPGVCRRRMGEVLGPNVHCQFLQGLGGNVRPRVLADPKASQFRKSMAADLEHAGRQLAEDVLGTLQSEGEDLDLEIAAAIGWLPAKRDLDRLPSLAHWASLAEGADELGRNLGAYWLERLRSGLPTAQMVPWDVGLVRLTGHHCVAWLAGEPVAEWLPYLRQWLCVDQVLGLGYCQELPGYLPTDALLSEGGYEVLQSSWYRKTGPGPLAQGLDDSLRQRFSALARQVRIGHG